MRLIEKKNDTVGVTVDNGAQMNYAAVGGQNGSFSEGFKISLNNGNVVATQGRLIIQGFTFEVSQASEVLFDLLSYAVADSDKRTLYLKVTFDASSRNSSYSFVLGREATSSKFIEEAGLDLPMVGLYRPKPKATYNPESYFQDPVYDVFESQVEETPPPPKDNGIRNWKVGDIAIHQVFGRGVVTGIIDGTILEIDFESQGKKSILASHPKLSREEKGAQA